MNIIKQQRALRSLLATGKYTNALLVLLICAIASFHPWFMDIISRAAEVLPLMILVLVFVYVVNPICQFFLTQLRRIPRFNDLSYTFSLVVTYVLLLLIVFSLLAICIPRLVQELQDLAKVLPGFAKTVQEKYFLYRHNYYDVLPEPAQEKIASYIGQVGSYVGSFISGGLQYAGALSSAIIWSIGATVLVPLISFYVLADGEGIKKYLLGLVPQKKQATISELLEKMHNVMQCFLKGQALLCFVIGTITTLVMAFILPKYCIALGLIAGITEAIPVIGPILGAIPAVFIAVALPDGGLGLALLVIAAYVVIQQLENSLLVPRIMGQSLGLHPLSLMVGMIVFGNMFGFWGVLLSAPIVGTCKIFVEFFAGKYEKNNNEELGEAPGEAPGDAPGDAPGEALEVVAPSTSALVGQASPAEDSSKE